MFPRTGARKSTVFCSCRFEQFDFDIVRNNPEASRLTFARSANLDAEISSWFSASAVPSWKSSNSRITRVTHAIRFMRVVSVLDRL